MAEIGWQQRLGRIGLAGAGLLAVGALTGCMAVGYSSGGGWFVWPGGLGLVLLLLLLYFVLRGRR